MEDNIFLAFVEDKFRQCLNSYVVTSTNFLDLRQRSLAEGLCRRLNKEHRDITCVFYGGYEDAERTLLIFLPDYADLTEYNPLSAIRINIAPGSRELTHRDYLGSLIGLGLKRETIGDILVEATSADIIITDEIKEFLILHYEKAGKTALTLKPITVSELHIPIPQIQERKHTVASLRLDNVVATAFSLTRTKAAFAIKRGLVFVNHEQVVKPDRKCVQGDKLVLRGSGKVVLQQVGHQTRKDRTFIIIGVY